jgi:hypothetical protein
MGDGGMRRPLVLAAILISMLLVGSLAGCGQFQIEARPPDVLNSLGSQALGRLEDRNVAVLAIDFDPPLDTISSFSDLEKVSLLVAIENTGLETVSDLTVRVELRLDNREPMPTLARMAAIDELAPGEVKIARLQGLSGIPIAPEYWLKVRVYPVNGEENVTDNQRIYRVHIGDLLN